MPQEWDVVLTVTLIEQKAVVSSPEMTLICRVEFNVLCRD